MKKTLKSSTSSNTSQELDSVSNITNAINSGKITLDASTILPLLQSITEILISIKTSNETIASKTTSGGNIIAMNNGGSQSYQPNSKQTLINSIISGI